MIAVVSSRFRTIAPSPPAMLTILCALNRRVVDPFPSRRTGAKPV